MEFDEEEARRDDAFYDELERAYIAELEHVRAGGVDLTKAILREEVYERLIGELEREDVSSDARDAVASFLQDLRRDGVEWHSIGHGRGYFEADDERRVFPEYAAPCTRATRIPGSVCMKFAHEHGAPWDQWTCAYAAGFGNLQSLQYAHEHGCPWDVWTCRDAAWKGHLECLKYAREHGCDWDGVTCMSAALNGHWSCFIYASFHGCRRRMWDDFLFVLSPYTRVRFYCYRIVGRFQHAVFSRCASKMLSLFRRLPVLGGRRSRTVRVRKKATQLMSLIDEDTSILPKGDYAKLCHDMRNLHKRLPG